MGKGETEKGPSVKAKKKPGWLKKKRLKLKRFNEERPKNLTKRDKGSWITQSLLLTLDQHPSTCSGELKPRTP